MPISFTIDNKLGIIRETWSGKVTVEDVRALWSHHVSDPEALALRATLADLRDATIEFGGWQMGRLIETVVDPVLQGRGWITAILVEGPVQLEMSRQFQELADHFSHDAIFFEEHDALEWLIRQRAGSMAGGRSIPWGDPGKRSGDPH